MTSLRHVKLAQRWAQLLAKVREIPEFENFLRPPRLVSILNRLPPDGPVVIIKYHPGRCDALLIAGRDFPYHIPLIFLSTKFHSKWQMTYGYACEIIFLPTEYAPEGKMA